MSQQNTSEVIDLGYIFKRSNDFFKSIIRGFFLVVDFFKKYFIVVIVLIVLGFAYGYYKDSKGDVTYNNEVLVIPNFESVDYLYDKIEVLNNKISSRDTLFLQQILDTNFRKLKTIKIEPIVDIYNFVSKSYRNYDVLKLIAEKQDFSEYIADLSTSKYYKYHKMEISISGSENSKEIVSKLFSYLNDNDHLKEYQKIFIESNKFEIQENYNMISQIDSVLLSNSRMNSFPSNVTINNNTDLYRLIEKKTELLDGLADLKTKEVDFKTPIKIVSADYNLKIKKFLSIPNKIKYPLMGVFLFSLVFFILYLFKGLRKYANSDQ